MDGSLVPPSTSANFIARKLGITFEPIVYANPESYTSSFGRCRMGLENWI
jgi:hypothetical protein